MTTAERLAHLQQARAAAAAVRDEMNSRNDRDPAHILNRAPILRRASNELTDLDLMINDLEGATEPIALDPILLAKLDALSTELDGAIAADGLVGLALGSVTRILEAVQEARDILA